MRKCFFGYSKNTTGPSYWTNSTFCNIGPTKKRGWLCPNPSWIRVPHNRFHQSDVVRLYSYRILLKQEEMRQRVAAFENTSLLNPQKANLRIQLQFQILGNQPANPAAKRIGANLPVEEHEKRHQQHAEEFQDCCCWWLQKRWSWHYFCLGWQYTWQQQRKRGWGARRCHEGRHWPRQDKLPRPANQPGDHLGDSGRWWDWRKMRKW